MTPPTPTPEPLECFDGGELMALLGYEFVQRAVHIVGSLGGECYENRMAKYLVQFEWDDGDKTPPIPVTRCCSQSVHRDVFFRLWPISQKANPTRKITGVLVRQDREITTEGKHQ